MSAQEIGIVALVAVLLFWGVGAYNRLVRLRGEVGRAFAALASQLLQRDALLLRWAEATRAFLEHEDGPAGQLPVTCEALRRAVERAKSRPHDSSLIVDLGAAEEAVLAARKAMAAELPIDAHHLSAVGAGLGSAVVQVGADLETCDTALAFARAQFNQRVGDYNRALLQFPTLLITRLFGFHAGAGL